MCYCFRYWIQINDKIIDILSLTLTFNISLLLLLANTARVCFARNYCVFLHKPCDLRNATESINPCIVLSRLPGNNISVLTYIFTIWFLNQERFLAEQRQYYDGIQLTWCFISWTPCWTYKTDYYISYLDGCFRQANKNSLQKRYATLCFCLLHSLSLIKRTKSALFSTVWLSYWSRLLCYDDPFYLSFWVMNGFRFLQVQEWKPKQCYCIRIWMRTENSIIEQRC